MFREILRVEEEGGAIVDLLRKDFRVCERARKSKFEATHGATHGMKHGVGGSRRGGEHGRPLSSLC